MGLNKREAAWGWRLVARGARAEPGPSLAVGSLREFGSADARRGSP
jgi:hypothetical protein